MHEEIFLHRILLRMETSGIVILTWLINDIPRSSFDPRLIFNPVSTTKRVVLLWNLELVYTLPALLLENQWAIAFTESRLGGASRSNLKKELSVLTVTCSLFNRKRALLYKKATSQTRECSISHIRLPVWNMFAYRALLVTLFVTFASLPTLALRVEGTHLGFKLAGSPTDTRSRANGPDLTDIRQPNNWIVSSAPRTVCLRTIPQRIWS